ncbi:beta-ketoacyl synthase N-terminal-like domain-containing protein [Paenibacillus pabuli]|uniref:beta-ketoacyl synthase N-terminal-like domain-containing protein n=1 Tax=Paenibacillus pabuli TaxID=1472 RepID=UPI003CF093F3
MKKLFFDESTENIEIHELERSIRQEPIAIIGMAGRFPLAEDLEQLWDNLKNSVDSVSGIPGERKQEIEAYCQSKQLSTDDLKYAEMSYLDDIDKFDADFFNIVPHEAKLMDPNQRLFLETAWKAAESAGYGGDRMRGTRTGVYLGFSNEGTSYKNLIEDVEPQSLALALPGNLQAIIASRISYWMDLKGPSMLIDTTCSSGLVAVHTACQEIRNRECEMAIAGSIKLHLTPFKNDVKLGTESSDGVTRSFDDQSDGIGLGEGVAAVVLKSLQKAIQDGDPIYAVIRGSAKNQDGASNGITAPNMEAQIDVITRAWSAAGVSPETITYIEAHGTGTKLGDPIEIAAIEQAFSRYTKRKQFCAIGSIKSNMGHLDTTAGLAGLIKAVLAIRHKELPPSCHFKKPNRGIGFENSPVYVNDRLSPWDVEGDLLRAGVSSFGLSGTNCHVVIENYISDQEKVTLTPEEWYPFSISARTESGLKQLIDEYIQCVNNNVYHLEDLSYSFNCTRGHFGYRIYTMARNKDQLVKQLRSALEDDWKKITDMPASQMRRERGYWLRGGDSSSINKINSDSLSTSQAIFLQLKAGNESRMELLEKTGELYIAGGQIAWKELYRGKRNRTIVLPTYPYQKKTYWLRSIQTNSGASSYGNLEYYKTCWVKEERTFDNHSGNTNGSILVIRHAGVSKDGLADRLVQMYRRNGRETVEAVIGIKDAESQAAYYTISNDENGYKDMLEYYRDKKIDQIIHLGAWNDENTLAKEGHQAMEYGFNSLIYLTKALHASENKHMIDIVLIAKNAHLITGGEMVIPEHSVYFGMAKGIGHEHLNLRCRCLDMDDDLSMSALLNELDNKENKLKVAYRKGERFVETIDEIKKGNNHGENITIKEGGVYLITGGTGDLGLEVGKWLARKSNVTLLLVNRTPFPERSEWDSVSAPSIKVKINTLRETEATGSEIYTFSGDIADKLAFEQIIHNWTIKSGRGIDGVFHCAGVSKPKLIINKSVFDSQSVMRAKVDGTRNLFRVLEREHPDFFVMFSSVSSLTGLYGNADYVAANCYLDAVASMSRNRVLSINWPAWKGQGMGQNFEDDADHLFASITSEQALASLDELMSGYSGQVIVGKLNKSHALLRYEKLSPVRFSKSVLDSAWTGFHHERSQQASRDEELHEAMVGYSETEKRVGRLFMDVLGISEINKHDHFNEIGGNSLFVVDLANRLEKEFPGLLDVADLYSYLSVAQIAEHIERKQNGDTVNDEEDSLNRLLDGVEDGSLSVNDALDLFFKED